MGSACELRFDDIEIAEQKGFVPDEFLFLFQERDRRTYRDRQHEEDQVGYFASRAVVLQRLDLAGYTAERARSAFEAWREAEFDSHMGDAAENFELLEALKALTYDAWSARMRAILPTRWDGSEPIDIIDRQMRDLDERWIFFERADALSSIRAMLDAMADVQTVSLNFTDLIHGGWMEPDEKIALIRRTPDLLSRSVFQPAVIIAEGSTDIAVLQRGLDRLHPHLRDYISFFDYEGARPDGGANWVVKFLRAFAAARVNSPVLAIFDNDTAGHVALAEAHALKLPKSYQVVTLPDITLAKDYPTIGPGGHVPMDVNGSAAGIELYLGRHNLLNDDGSLNPIVWSDRHRPTGKYQGALLAKSTPFDRFMEETKPA
jgi:hypothetical protein